MEIVTLQGSPGGADWKGRTRTKAKEVMDSSVATGIAEMPTDLG